MYRMNKLLFYSLVLFLLSSFVSAVDYTLQDKTGYGRDLANTGATYNVAGNYYSCDGTNDRLNRTELAAIMVANSYTITMKMKINSFNSARPIQNAFGTNDRFGASFAGTNLRAGAYSGTFYSNEFLSLSSGVWYNFAFVYYAGTNLTLYKDGVYSTPSVNNPSTDYVGFFLCSGRYGNYFNGSIADVRIFNTTLSADEVLNVSLNRTVKCSNLYAWYNFSNSSSTGCNESAPPVSDCTEPSANLYLNNHTTFCTGAYSIGIGAIVINASNINVTCNQTIITGSGMGTNNRTSFFIHYKNNITIQGCNFTEYYRAIHLNTSNNITVKNISCSRTTICVDLESTNHSLISNINMNRTTDGIRTQPRAWFNTVTNSINNNSYHNCYDADGFYNNFTNNVADRCTHSSLDMCGFEHELSYFPYYSVGTKFDNNTVYNGGMFYSCYGINNSLVNNKGYNINRSDSNSTNGFGLERFYNTTHNYFIENNTFYQGYRGLNLTEMMVLSANATVKNSRFNGTAQPIDFQSYCTNPYDVRVYFTFINNSMINGSAMKYRANAYTGCRMNQTNVSIYQNSSYQLSVDTTAGEGTQYTLYSYGIYNDARYSNGSVIQNDFTTLSGYLSNGLTIEVGNYSVSNTSCVYGGSGDFTIPLADNCIINTNYNVSGEIILSGTGNVYFNSTIDTTNLFSVATGQAVHILANCRIY